MQAFDHLGVCVIELHCNPWPESEGTGAQAQPWPAILFVFLSSPIMVNSAECVYIVKVS